MRTSNPTLNENTFSKVSYAGSETMTMQGTVNKSFTLVLCILLTAGISWIHFFNYGGAWIMPLTLGGAIGGLILALVTAFKKEWSHITAPLYALLQGLFLGGISAIYESIPGLEGITLMAVALTMGTFVCLLMLYKSGWITVTQNFRLGVMAATGAIGLIYLVSFILSLFGVNIPYIHDNGPIGIIFAAIVVAVAALNLVLDFDYIEQGCQANVPKYMEWYAAFGLVVTLIWLYVSILRLLARIMLSRK